MKFNKNQFPNMRVGCIKNTNLFFDRTNACSLADALLSVCEDENLSQSFETQAISLGFPAKHFADDLVDLVLSVVDEHRHSSKVTS
jgi:hypothetical protein